MPYRQLLTDAAGVSGLIGPLLFTGQARALELAVVCGEPCWLCNTRTAVGLQERPQPASASPH